MDDLRMKKSNGIKGTENDHGPQSEKPAGESPIVWLSQPRSPPACGWRRLAVAWLAI
jgi:hypothetical protein